MYIKKSSNRKLSKSKNADVTYAPVKQTCSNTCELKRNGCYATASTVALMNSRLEKSMDDLSKVEIAKQEAKCIDDSYDGGLVQSKLLRLHVSGDSDTITGTKYISAAAKRWIKRGGEYVWSYTHSWEKVNRKNWGVVSVLASVDTVEQISEARNQGYAPAMVFPEFKDKKAFIYGDTKFIPCPSQTHEHIDCETCKLCFKADDLFKRNAGIAFEVHGVSKNTLKKKLRVIR